MDRVIDQIPEFGRIDAESEVQLGEFFLRTDAYARIEDQEHVVVTGRKGTGKTAIYKTLLQRPADYGNFFVTGLQFRDYPWGTHDQVQDSDASPVERYFGSWEFLILVELSKLILTSENHESPKTDSAAVAARVLAEFIETNWGELGFRFRDIFNKTEYSFKFEPRVFGTSLGALEMSKVPRDRLAGVLSDANRWLRQCLEYLLNPACWYFVLFDDLDLGFDPRDDQYSARLIGLLLAARSIFNWSNQNPADTKGLGVAPVIFVRSDIYDSLSFPDKNKVTENLVEPLTWTDEEEGENSLKSLINQRIRVILRNGGADPWDAVFEEQLMRGTQAKFKHMAARTYLRPRDMIKFANVCLERAKAAETDRITNQNIAEARPEYSEFLISELHDEIHPVLEDWRRYLDALRRIHTMRFRREAFEEAYQELNLGDSGLGVDDALELLYRFSVIGFTKIGGAGYGGSAVTFRFRSPGVNFDPAAPYFNVHPGLKEALELVEAGEDSATKGTQAVFIWPKGTS